MADSGCVTDLLIVGCVTDLLVDLTQPISPKLELQPEDDDNDFLTTIPNVCSAEIFIGVNDVSYSMDRPKQTENDSHHSSDSITQLLDEEQFDFDLPNWAIASDVESDDGRVDATPEDEPDDDDEVFFGPVGHTEKCVAVAVNEVAKVNEKQRPLSPLTASEMAELCREACTIASRIEVAAGVSRRQSGGQVNLTSQDDDQHSYVEVEASDGPLGNLMKSLGNALPSADLPQDKGGVVIFSASSKPAAPKEARPVTRHSTGLARTVHSGSTKTSIKSASTVSSQVSAKSKLQTMPNGCSNPVRNSIQNKSQLIETSVTVSKMAVKRQCVSSAPTDSVDVSDTASVTSDTSDCSIFNPATGKRTLPQPKFTRTALPSKLPLVGPRAASASDATHLSSDSSQSSVVSAFSDTALPSVTSTPTLQRAGIPRLNEPLSRLPAPSGLRPPKVSGVITTGDGVLSAVSGTTEKASGLRPPVKPDLLSVGGSALPGLDKRKTLTAIRSLNAAGGGPKQGPLRAMMSDSVNESMAANEVKSVSKGVCLPSATSTPCRPVRPDARLNTSLCTPSRGSNMKPPSSVTGSVQRRMSSIQTPSKRIPITQDDPTASCCRSTNTAILRSASVDSKTPAKTPLNKENLLELKRRSLSTAAGQQKTAERTLDHNAKNALRLSNN